MGFTVTHRSKPQSLAFQSIAETLPTLAEAGVAREIQSQNNPQLRAEKMNACLLATQLLFSTCLYSRTTLRQVGYQLLSVCLSTSLDIIRTVPQDTPIIQPILDNSSWSLTSHVVLDYVEWTELCQKRITAYTDTPLQQVYVQD